MFRILSPKLCGYAARNTKGVELVLPDEVFAFGNFRIFKLINAKALNLSILKLYSNLNIYVKKLSEKGND